jgi:hypothetical protein
MHGHIVEWLKSFVRWFFNGDYQEWKDNSPYPVVLRSSDPTKYSSHVVFPQIQFANHGVQREYLSMLLSSLPALEVHLDDGKALPILEKLVDRAPYMPFQLFRGPYASKLSGGRFRRETQLEPETIFNDDPLACFAGHVDKAYALDLLPPAQLLDLNEELKHWHKEHLDRVAGGAYFQGGVSSSDMTNLYLREFQQFGGGYIDLAGLTDLEKYEEAMQLLHPDRASHWWSWFRISGVTFRMLEQYHGDPKAVRRIWDAHLQWSRTYPYFDETENVDQVWKCRGRHVSGIQLLMKLVEFDNPDARVRCSIYKYHFQAPRPVPNDSKGVVSTP